MSPYRFIRPDYRRDKEEGTEQPSTFGRCAACGARDDLAGHVCDPRKIKARDTAMLRDYKPEGPGLSYHQRLAEGFGMLDGY